MLLRRVYAEMKPHSSPTRHTCNARFQSLPRDFSPGTSPVGLSRVARGPVQNAKSRIPCPMKMESIVSMSRGAVKQAKFRSPHKRFVPRKILKSPVPHKKTRDNVEIPHSVNRRTRNPDVCQAPGTPAQKGRLLIMRYTCTIHNVPSHRFSSQIT